LCDTSVKQYSGYLDIADDKHLFFWFFESRNSPSTDPLVLWLNGGPGCSSSTGLLFELGPCSIANEGKNTTFNKHSWTSSANMIVSRNSLVVASLTGIQFLDQPVNVARGARHLVPKRVRGGKVYSVGHRWAWHTRWSGPKRGRQGFTAGNVTFVTILEAQVKN
ncbi:serine carboxypeptidase-domain-containing protein, partial [Mycena olivaceomarginata]